jgi:hypothetical protein
VKSFAAARGGRYKKVTRQLFACLNWHFSATELLLPCQLLALQRAVANCFHPRITAQSNWLRGCAIPSDAPTPWHRGIVARIVLGMQIDAGRADIGMAQVVTDHFEIYLVAQMAASRVAPMSLER